MSNGILSQNCLGHVVLKGLSRKKSRSAAHEILLALHRYGTVVNFRRPVDGDGKLEKYCYISFLKKESATSAVEDGSIVINDRTVTIEWNVLNSDCTAQLSNSASCLSVP